MLALAVRACTCPSPPSHMHTNGIGGLSAKNACRARAFIALCTRGWGALHVTLPYNNTVRGRSASAHLDSHAKLM